MTLNLKTTARLLGSLALASTLVACDNTDNDTVRDSPQVANPSPSAPAQQPLTGTLTPDV